jgi:hypothetical protein
MTAVSYAMLARRRVLFGFEIRTLTRQRNVMSQYGNISDPDVASWPAVINSGDSTCHLPVPPTT